MESGRPSRRASKSSSLRWSRSGGIGIEVDTGGTERGKRDEVRRLVGGEEKKEEPKRWLSVGEIASLFRRGVDGDSLPVAGRAFGFFAGDTSEGSRLCSTGGALRLERDVLGEDSSSVPWPNAASASKSPGTKTCDSIFSYRSAFSVVQRVSRPQVAPERTRAPCPNEAASEVFGPLAGLPRRLRAQLSYGRDFKELK